MTTVHFNTKNTTIDTMQVVVEDEMLIKVAKHSMVLVHFTTENVEMENLPLAYFPYPRMEKIEISPSGYSFTEPNATQLFNIQVSPENTWDKKVEWTLLNNSGNYGILESDTYSYVYSGRSLENDSDSLILRATNRNGKVQSEVVIQLPKATGIENVKINSAFKIYPNPAKDSVTVKLNEEGTVRIFSLEGVKVIEQKVHRGNNLIKTDGLPQGIYSVQFGEKSERLIIHD